MIEDDRDEPEPREIEGVFRMPLDLGAIQMRTWGSEEQFERYQKAVAQAFLDTDKDNRQQRHRMCRRCYYLRVGVVATQAFTNKPCKRLGCSGRTEWHNGDTPDFCGVCAETLGICRRCGGDVEFRDRRSIKPPKAR